MPNYGVLEYAPGNGIDPPSLQFSAVRLEDGRVLYSEVVRAGRGGVDVRLRNSRDGRWRITGAYFVEGAGDAILPNLAPGDYRIEFLDSVLSEALQGPIEFSVRDGQVQVVEGAFRPKDPGATAIVFYDGFFADSLGEYEVIDQGTLDAPSDWHIQGGQLRQNGNIYDQLGDGSGLPLDRFGTMLVRRGLEVGDGLYSWGYQGLTFDDLIVRGPEAALLISSIRIGDGAVVIEAMAGNGVEAPELDHAEQVLNPIWTALDTNTYTVTRAGELYRFRVQLSAGEGSRYFRLRAAP